MVGFLGFLFFLEGRVKLSPAPVYTRYNYAWNLVRKYIHTCSFRKYTFQYQDLRDFGDVSIFWQKFSIFLAEMVLLLKAIVWKLC